MSLRSRRPAVLVAVAALPLLAACAGGTTTGAGSPAPGGSSLSTLASSPSAQAAQAAQAAQSGGGAASGGSSAAAGSYIDHATYRADAARYGSGRVVLFFHAPWCPDCRRTEENLQGDPAAIPAGLTVVKVDYDSATDLRKQYGITQQHTFVSVGPDGAKKAVWTGTHTAAEIAARAV